MHNDLSHTKYLLATSEESGKQLKSENNELREKGDADSKMIAEYKAKEAASAKKKDDIRKKWKFIVRILSATAILGIVLFFYWMYEDVRIFLGFIFTLFPLWKYIKDFIKKNKTTP